LILYRETESGVEVTRIVHAARDWLALVDGYGPKT
jgi:hypothetical protein